jgi:hypothetical protein
MPDYKTVCPKCGDNGTEVRDEFQLGNLEPV